MSSTRRTGRQRAAIHGQDRYYDLAGFLAGANPLREVELALCGDVAGKDLLHLQCHFGLDTLGCENVKPIWPHRARPTWAHPGVARRTA